MRLSVTTPRGALVDTDVEEVTAPGEYVKIEDTIAGFQEIIDGKHDELPEQAFYMVGGIEMAVEKARQLSGDGGGKAEEAEAAEAEADKEPEAEPEPAGASA